MVTKKVISAAKRCAEKSTSRFRLGAVVFMGNKIIGCGWNQMNKTHLQSPHPYKFIHAEFNSLLGIKRGDLRRASIYIHRLKKDGSTGLAKPCNSCAGFLSYVGIKKVYFSF